MENDRKNSKWTVLLVLVVLVLFGFAMFVYFNERSRIFPPRDSVVNLELFKKTMPPPKRLVVLDFGGSNRFIWVGEKSRWLISSGPPCYVFDSSGRMIEWDWETGGGQSTTALVQAANEAPAISVEKAIEIVVETYRPVAEGQF